ncbi:MAG: hypothetical protein WB816_12130 [Methylocystis sp.]
MDDKSKSGALKFETRKSLQKWLESLPPEQGRWFAVAIAARAALRVVPLVAMELPHENEEEYRRRLPKLIFAALFAGALSRVAAKYSNHAKGLRAADAATAPFSAHTPAAVAAAYAASAANAAAAGTTDAAYTAAATAAYTANAAAAPYTADAEIWVEISRDANFVISGVMPEALVSMPLWPDGAPNWADEYWKRLQYLLPHEDSWQAWTDWYNRRLDGVSDLDEIELPFATIPERVRTASPASANRWIQEQLHVLIESSRKGARVEKFFKELEGLQKEDLPPPPQPIENLPSPFTFGCNAAGQITVITGPQNTPAIAFPGDDKTHRRWLETSRKLTERLIADLESGKFYNVRPDYREGLARYANDLPPEPGAGNFLLADAEARKLLKLFIAEARVLSEPFAVALRTVLESHFALLGFYPEVARYLTAAREGQVTAPLPQEAIDGFGKAILDNTPQAFTSEVSQGLHDVEREVPKVELDPEDIRGGPPPVMPPVYPYEEPDLEKSRVFSIMSTFNALYKAVLETTNIALETAKNDPSKIVHWIAIEEMLRPYAIMIIEWLKLFCPPTQ